MPLRPCPTREASARVINGLYNGLTGRNGFRRKDEKRSRTECQRWANPQGAPQSRLLSTWKPFGLSVARRVGFNRLSRTEAGIYSADSEIKNGLGHHVNETVFVYAIMPEIRKFRFSGENL